MSLRIHDARRAVVPIARETVAWRRAGRKLPQRCLVVLITVLSGGGLARAGAPQELLERYKCNFCHSDTEAGTGPAFVEVAAKYRNNENAVAVLTAAVRKGAHGSGPWHMPPHPEVSQADAEAMVRYILSRK